MNGPFGSNPHATYPGTKTITVRGLTVTVHSPEATKSRFAGGVEQIGRLAPGRPVEVFPVDSYPDAPERWLRNDEANNVVSFFFRAEPNHMVWFDFNENARDRHDVAVLISAQGVCALTGRTMDRPTLQQFRENCPIHGEAFGNGNLCRQCGFAWPPQNYLSNTSCGPGAFWRDGFMGEDHTTREFLFTTDERRGVAASLIGSERMSAFGLALFRSEQEKPQPVYHSATRGGLEGFLGGGLEGCSPTRGYSPESFSSVEVAAGALVSQKLERDPKPLSHWRRSPDAMILLYYAGPEEFAHITRSGPKRRGSFLGGTGIPTGNNG